MRLIKQKNDVDCGIAVAAMVAGVSYRKAWGADPNPESERGVTTPEMLALLNTLSTWRWRWREEWVLGRWAPVGRFYIWPDVDRGVLLLKERRGKFGHWVAWEWRESRAGAQIWLFDSEVGKFRQDEYPRGNWRIYKWILPLRRRDAE